MNHKINTLSYYGGKSSNTSVNRWINGVLGPNLNTYIEPFAGMLGIMLMRSKSRSEIINDSNCWVSNWWVQCRDNSEELSDLVIFTPRDRNTFVRCVKEQYEKNSKGYIASTVHDAWVFYIICHQSFVHGNIATKGQYIVSYKGSSKKLLTDRCMLALRERLIKVQIENVCATRIMEATRSYDHCIIYCDPPYRSADTRAYGKWELDVEEFMALCVGHNSRIAISGYGAEWDGLLEHGWNRLELETMTSTTTHTGKKAKRTEVLWCNFKDHKMGQLPIF